MYHFSIELLEMYLIPCFFYSLFLMVFLGVTWRRSMPY